MDMVGIHGGGGGVGDGGGGIVSVDPKPRKGIISSALDLIEKIVVSLMWRRTPDPNPYLSGCFAPVKNETPPCGNLPIRGYIPECLNGEFVRVGPNPKHQPVSGYHWFDGDGMIHGLRIKNGNATYVSRFVKTSRFKQEEYFGRAQFLKLGDLKGLLGLVAVILNQLRDKLKVLDYSFGDKTGNTALVYHHGKLLALNEADKPYVIKVLEDGDLQTLGEIDYDKRLTRTFTAHPKVDPITDEMFAFGYSFEPPYVTYHVITKEGVMLEKLPITIPDPIMMHDFAITENYAIFMDLPLYFSRKKMVQGGFFLSFDNAKKARFGVLPRYAKNELQMKWFELPNCFIYHNANAWEEGDEVVLITCRLQNYNLDAFTGTTDNRHTDFKTELYEMRFNMENGTASQKQLSVSTVEFPRINQTCTGRKQRFVYAAILENLGEVKGIVKFDLQAEPDLTKSKPELGGNVKGIFRLGPGRYGSEAIYVPRQQDATSDEDDGYLIFFVNDENTGKSEANVLDAKTMSPDPVAVVEIPAKIPQGFHALFITEEQLNQQLS